MKVLQTNSAQSSVIDTEESRHSQRKDQLVSLALCFTTQQVDRQKIYKKAGDRHPRPQCSVRLSRRAFSTKQKTDTGIRTNFVVIVGLMTEVDQIDNFKKW